MTFVPSAEQRAVIEYGLEPLRVTAGAGTGKTSTLAHRMARLVDRGGILPEQVLGVTFTNKAAGELAGRIREVRAGASVPGHEVDVFTYHGFAAHLLRTYGVLVGMERDTRIITPPLTRRILRECVTATPFEAVDTTNVRGVIDSLIKLSGELADNLIHPDALLTGTPTDEVEARRAELAAALVGFEEAKRRLGVCDYGDLIRLAVDLVRDHPVVADRIRVRYRCVLLDEYQDTNPAQRELFASLFGRDVPVTAVGDLDQTIYEWRGASPANFESFPGRFRRTDGLAARTLRLSFNRRSGQRILDLANRIRTRISVTDPAGDLVALDGNPPGEVHVSWHDDARREAEEIAYETRRLHEAGVGWSDMAVLFRRNRDIQPVRLALEEHDVPLQVADLGGLLQVPEIVEIQAWLRLLADPEDGPALVRILVGSRFRLGLSDLAPLCRWVAEQSRRTDDRALGHTLVEALEHLDAFGVTGERRESLDGFRQLYRTLLTESQGTNLSDLVRLILSRTGAWQEIDAMPRPGRPHSPAQRASLPRLHRALEPARGRILAGSLPRATGVDTRRSGPRAGHCPDRRRGRRDPHDRPPGQGTGVASGVPPGAVPGQLPGYAPPAARSRPMRLHPPGPPAHRHRVQDPPRSLRRPQGTPGMAPVPPLRPGMAPGLRGLHPRQGVPVPERGPLVRDPATPQEAFPTERPHGDRPPSRRGDDRPLDRPTASPTRDATVPDSPTGTGPGPLG